MDKAELRNLAEELDLQCDEELLTIFGHRDHYTFYIEPTDQNKQYRICFAVKGGDIQSAADLFQQLVKDSKVLASSQVNHYKLSLYVKSGMTKKKTSENISQALEEILDFLRSSAFVNVSEHSGESQSTDVYQLGGNLLILTADDFQELASSLSLDNQIHESKKENIVMGTVGAFLGSLLGAALIFFIAQLGYVSYFGGLVMGVCAVKGYELLGKKFSKVGIVICTILMIVITFFVHQLDIVVTFMREYGGQADFFGTFEYLTSYIFGGGEVPGNYWFNLAVLYVFTALGAFASFSSALSNQSQRYAMRKL